MPGIFIGPNINTCPTNSSHMHFFAAKYYSMFCVIFFKKLIHAVGFMIYFYKEADHK